MAQCQCQPNFHSISTTFKKDLSWRWRGLEPYPLSINRGRETCNWRQRWQIPQCCSSSFPVSSTTTTREEVGLKWGNRRGEYEVECFVNENGWKVRRMIETEQEMRKVAGVQAEAFHEPVFIFNDMFFEFFLVLSKTPYPDLLDLCSS